MNESETCTELVAVCRLALSATKKRQVALSRSNSIKVCLVVMVELIGSTWNTLVPALQEIAAAQAGRMDSAKKLICASVAVVPHPVT